MRGSFFLLRHFCCEKKEAQVGWVADIISMKVRGGAAGVLGHVSEEYAPAEARWSDLMMQDVMGRQ